MELFCSYLVGMVVAFFFLVYMFRTAVPMMIFWPIALALWALRGFPPAPYDFRLAPDEARAQGKRPP